MSVPRRHLSRRLTAGGLALCGVIALGGCASMSNVPDQDFGNSGSDGGGTHNGNGGSTHNGNGGSGSSHHNGTVSIYARHSQKVVVRNESKQAVHSTTMSRGEHVTYSLSPGTYTIVSTSSDGVCVVTVNVRSNATTRVNVGC